MVSLQGNDPGTALMVSGVGGSWNLAGALGLTSSGLAQGYGVWEECWAEAASSRSGGVVCCVQPRCEYWKVSSHPL